VWEQQGGRRGEEEVRGRAKPIAVAAGLWVGLQVSVKHIRYMCILTYRGGPLQGLLCGPAGPGQCHQNVSYWTLNSILNDIVLTSGYAEDLGNACLDLWGSEEGSEEEGEAAGPAEPIASARGLWVGIQASAKYMRYMCIRTYTEGSLLGS